MAESCKEQQIRVEEETLQPIDRFVKEQRERCENEECNPWLLCLNQLVCWFVWVTVKITEWVVIVVVRWVYRLVCVTVSLVVGMLALIFTFNADVLIRALQDLAELVKDATFLAVGAILLYGNQAIDSVLTSIRLKDGPRKLTKEEIAILRPIFGDSLWYEAIEVNEGRLGIMGPPFAPPGGATTMGYKIYFRTYSVVTLVHECVHVWQFQFGGTHYIGQSATFQIGEWLGGEDPYDWLSKIGDDVNGWYLMESIEAQAEFIEDVFSFGKFVSDDGTTDDSAGAFFREDDGGNREFIYGLDDFGIETTDPANGASEFTRQAIAAWTILRTG
jgi:hypothetical protein